MRQVPRGCGNGKLRVLTHPQVVLHVPNSPTHKPYFVHAPSVNLCTIFRRTFLWGETRGFIHKPFTCGNAYRLRSLDMLR